MGKKIAGFDIGTGNSCCCVFENGKPVVVANSEGGRTTPSVVSLIDGDRRVGESAKRQQIVHPKETIYNIKRFMGATYDGCEKIRNSVAYDVVNSNGKPRVKVDGREYSPEEITSYIVNKMKKTAEDYLGEEVKDVVITVPAWFDNAAREATKLAGEMCGLNVLRCTNEPTAGILASNIDAKDGDKKVLVADIGQGTTDFSLCEISDGLVEVLASEGSVFLGGSDFDNAIRQWMIDQCKEENGVDLSQDVQAMQRLTEAAEKAKIELSSMTSTEINLPYITVKDGNPIHFVKTLTRAKMEQLTSHLVEEVVSYGRSVCKKANVEANELNCILLVGGQSRSLAIQEALTKEFNVPLNHSVNPDEAVAIGAAIQANIIVGGEGSSDILLLDVTPLNLGIETAGGVMTQLIEENTTIPCKRSQIFTTAAPMQTSVTINVLQGIRPMASQNKSIGQFNLDGIAPAPQGVPQIEVSFDIDANGILSVSAVDKATNKEQHITIENNNSLSKEEIERIKAEAKEYEAEDARLKKAADDKNKCESTIYQTQTQMESMKDHLSDDDKTFFNGKVEELKKMSESSDYTKLESVLGEIQTRWYAISAKAYQSSNPNGANVNFGDLFGQMGGSGNPFANANFNGANDKAKKPEEDVQDV